MAATRRNSASALGYGPPRTNQSGARRPDCLQDICCRRVSWRARGDFARDVLRLPPPRYPSGFPSSWSGTCWFGPPRALSRVSTHRPPPRSANTGVRARARPRRPRPRDAAARQNRNQDSVDVPPGCFGGNARARLWQRTVNRPPDSSHLSGQTLLAGPPSSIRDGDVKPLRASSTTALRRLGRDYCAGHLMLPSVLCDRPPHRPWPHS